VTSLLSANNTGTLGARVYVCLNLIHPLPSSPPLQTPSSLGCASSARVHVTPKESDDATRCLIIEKQFGDVKIITRGRRDANSRFAMGGLGLGKGGGAYNGKMRHTGGEN
jgi:hypothetical protein